MNAVRIVSRARRGVALAVAGALGCAMHGLLFALAERGWVWAVGPRPLPTAVLSSVTVVVGLAWIAPSAVWWPSAHLAQRAKQRESGERRLSGWTSLLALSVALSRAPAARRRARRDAVWVHGVLGALVLGVAVALTLGGLWWTLLGLAVLCALLSPLWVGALTRRVARGHEQHQADLDAAASGAPRELPTGVRRVLVGLSGAGLAALACVVWHLGEPAPAALGGSCTGDVSDVRVRLPGHLPGTPLALHADAESVTLAAADGGGPGRVVLASPWLTWPGLAHGSSAFSTSSGGSDRPLAPTVAWVHTTRSQLRVTLCTEPVAGVDARAHTLRLAPGGYRLDDGVTERLLRSPLGALLAFALLLLTLAYSRWGWPALLRAFTGEVPSTRVAVGWALLWGGAQLVWVLVTALGA